MEVNNLNSNAQEINFSENEAVEILKTINNKIKRMENLFKNGEAGFAEAVKGIDP